MIISFLLFLSGLLLLIKGGDWFVDGAVGIAQRTNMPKLLIGATVVSIGTTLPEVLVSVTSSLSGHGDIAFGNAIGSIICNTALIAALTISFRPVKINKNILRMPTFFFFLACTVYIFSAYTFKVFSRITGAVLLSLFFIYLIFTIYKSKQITSEANDLPEHTTILKNIFYLILGGGFIAYGSDLIVENGINIAKHFHIPEAVIALTFVALGTSLPELVTALSSLVKGHGTLSIGNIIGANFFNLVLVTGSAALLSPFAIPMQKFIYNIPSALLIDLPCMLIAMLILCIPPLLFKKLFRIQGVILLCLYVSFLAIQFLL